MRGLGGMGMHQQRQRSEPRGGVQDMSPLFLPTGSGAPPGTPSGGRCPVCPCAAAHRQRCWVMWWLQGEMPVPRLAPRVSRHGLMSDTNRWRRRGTWWQPGRCWLPGTAVLGCVRVSRARGSAGWWGVRVVGVIRAGVPMSPGPISPWAAEALHLVACWWPGGHQRTPLLLSPPCVSREQQRGLRVVVLSLERSLAVARAPCRWALGLGHAGLARWCSVTGVPGPGQLGGAGVTGSGASEGLPGAGRSGQDPTPPALSWPPAALLHWAHLLVMDWSISPRRRGWGSWACSAWRREGCEGTLEMPLNICRVGVRRTGPDSFQWCPATGQGATGTNWSRGSSSWTRGRTSSLW